MPPPSISLPAFVRTIVVSDQSRHVALPGFVRRRIRSTLGLVCPLCAVPFDPRQPRSPAFPVVATLVHPALGGPLTADNAFACCRRCQQLRRAADLLAIGPLTDPLRAQRATVLLASQNHLVPRSPSTRPADFARALTRRHLWPRSRVFAAQCGDGTCYLGVSSRFGDAQSKGLARMFARLVGSIVHQDHSLTVHQLDEDDFRTQVWRLIDSNALVVALAHPTHPRDFLDCWWITSASPSDLRLRQVGIAVPDPNRRATSSAPSHHSARERLRLEADLRDARRQSDLLRQAINDQHKARWLDGIEPTDGIADLLDRLDAADLRCAELRRRLLTLPPPARHQRRRRLSFP